MVRAAFASPPPAQKKATGKKGAKQEAEEAEGETVAEQEPEEAPKVGSGAAVLGAAALS
jgi:hypothetical protein